MSKFKKNKTTFSTLIRTHRFQQKISQDKFAKILGTNSCCIVNWESGKFHPNTKSIKRLIQVCGWNKIQVYNAILNIK